MIGKFGFALQLFATAAGSGQHAFEWAGIFSTPGNTYTWTAQKTENNGTMAYAETTMKLVAIPVSTADETTLHAVEHQGDAAIQQSTCSALSAGEVIVPGTNACYNLVFDQDTWQTLYTVNTTGINGVAFFAEHFPTEFENDAHYLKDPSAEDIEPLAELPEAVVQATSPSPAVAEKDTPWGEGIGASIIVNFVALIGIIMMIPALSKAIKNYHVEAEGILGAFAAGAILSCAFFLLLFEATHLVATGWQEEVDVLWRWGTMILAGILLPSIIHSFASISGTWMARKANSAEAGGGPASAADKPDEYVDGQPMARNFPEQVRLFVGVNLGDFFHNLCDGFFLGAGFKGCGSSFGWGIALATVLHEIPQEIADYVILTGPRVGVSPLIALVSNFISGLGVLLGTVIVLGADVGDDVVGLLLAFGGGVYIHIGAVECMPKMYAEKLSPLMRVACVASFIFGAVLIGLVLLDHEHCVPPTPPGVKPAPAASAHAHGHR